MNLKLFNRVFKNIVANSLFFKIKARFCDGLIRESYFGNIQKSNVKITLVLLIDNLICYTYK